MTAANFNYTVDYSSKTPPVVQMTWPLDGMQIASSNVTLRGQVDDATVTVTATVTDTSGDVNTVSGEVERNGRFWVEDLPLNSGNNTVSITFSNVINQTTVTNLALAQSPVILTINPVSDDTQLWQPTVSVTGTVSDSTYAVWVNGIPATVTPDSSDAGGTWSADNVPTTAGGVAIFDATAYPPGKAPDASMAGTGVNPRIADASSSAAAASTSANPDKPMRLYVDSNFQSQVMGSTDNAFQNGSLAGWRRDHSEYNHYWADGAGGNGEEIRTSETVLKFKNPWFLLGFERVAHKKAQENAVSC